MKKLKITEEFKAYTEEEAIQALNDLRANQNKEGYTLGANGYKYKTKKAKGEIIGEVWVCKITKIFGGVWDDYE
jgi:hypothetical protein